MAKYFYRYMRRQSAQYLQRVLNEFVLSENDQYRSMHNI